MASHGSSWQPREDGLVQLCQIFTEVLTPGSDQARILQQLEQFRQFSEFNNYLTYIFAQGEKVPLEVRQSAGLELKNSLKANYSPVADEYKVYMRDSLLGVLAQPVRVLRQTAGTVITTIVGQEGLHSWPQLTVALGQLLQSGDANMLDGALDTCNKLVEDHSAQFQGRQPSGRWSSDPASTVLTPLFLELFKSPLPDVRRQAVRVVNMLARDMPSGLHQRIDTYTQGLFFLAKDPDNKVRKEVVMGLVQMLDVHADQLVPQMPQVIEYMLMCNEDPDEEVALESCEFWKAYCDAEMNPETLRAYLPRLVPLLMKNMVYSEFDDDVQEAEAAEVPGGTQDREQDIRPSHLHHYRPETEENMGEDGEDLDEEEEREEYRRWTLRKCSARALDTLSTIFGDALLPIVMPVVQQRLQDPDWRARESAILALGAVCEGCHQGLKPYLGEIVTMLVPKTKDPRPMVRIISCWALGRFSIWLVEGPPGPPEPSPRDLDAAVVQLYDQLLRSLLQGLHDLNPQVQASACSSVATVEELTLEGGHPELIHDRLPLILEHLGKAISSYSKRNLRLVYDCLVVLASVVRRVMARADLAPLYLPPLIERWVGSPSNDKELLPLMECLTGLLPHLGSAVEPYAKAIFDKSLQIALINYEARQQSTSSSTQPSPSPAAAASLVASGYEQEFLVCAMDVLSALTQALRASIEALMSPTPATQMILQCCSDSVSLVRQMGFALVGDLSQCCVSLLLGSLPVVVQVALKNLEPQVLLQENMSACNNACWSLGEFALALPQPEALQPYAVSIAEHMTLLLGNTVRLTKSLKENAAITLGRVAMRCPEVIAPHLGHFCSPWCATLRNIRDEVEKEQAFLGLCRVVRLNPEAAAQGFPSIAGAVVSWYSIHNDVLQKDIIQLIHMLRELCVAKGQWDQIRSSLEPAVVTKLQTMCQL